VQFRILHNEESGDSYRSPSIDGAVAKWMLRYVKREERTRTTRNSYRILFGKPPVKGPLGSLRNTDRMKIDLTVLSRVRMDFGMRYVKSSRSIPRK